MVAPSQAPLQRLARRIAGSSKRAADAFKPLAGRATAAGTIHEAKAKTPRQPAATNRNGARQPK
jgi:hypothetical protein